jgi:hypothetical protein
MSTRANGASILVGLATLGGALTLGLDTQGSSITITGQQRPGKGDPPYDFLFDVTLENNSPSVKAGDYFTIQNLIGITPANFPAAGDQGSSSSAPSSNWVPMIGPLTQSASPPYASDVTWTYEGNSPIPGDLGAVFLGQFTVETAISFSSPPYPDGAIINYSYNIGGQTSAGSGSFSITTTIPEPSSMVILVTGTGVVSLLLPVYRQRGRRRHTQFGAA